MAGKKKPNLENVRISCNLKNEDEKQQIAYDSFTDIAEESDIDSEEENSLLPKQRHGDVISSHRALLTLIKGFVGSGCLSLPYAWKQGGLWVSFSLQIIVSITNWYSNHILSTACQQLAVKSGRPALDYGHLAKKTFDYSGIPSLEKRSKIAMYIVNFTVMLYQLGCCAVPIVFVATNMNNLIKKHFDIALSNAVYASIILIPLAISNMIARMRVMSWLAVAATLLWFFGTGAMLQQCFRVPSQLNKVPASTDIWSTILFFGTAMYAYEGQTMILPVENKMRHPEDFTRNCGVLPTVMALVTVFYTAIGFFGYTAYGENTLGTLSLNMPDTTLFTVVTVALTIMAFLAHPINLYVIFEMLWPGFKRKSAARYAFVQQHPQATNLLFRLFWVLLTYLLAVMIPRIEQMTSLVGVTAGSLLAFCYPTILEILACRDSWRRNRSTAFISYKYIFNTFLFVLGLILTVVGLYVNVADMLK